MESKKRLLLVDDEPDVAKVAVFRLRKAGYEVMTAEDGKSGLELAKRAKPDLILLDYKLPGMTGVEVYKKLQSEDNLKDVPVIFLTASSSEDLKTGIEGFSQDHYLKKPYEPEELLQRVAQALKISPEE